MSILTTANDIRLDALHESGELIDGTSEFHAKSLEYINHWHRKVLAGATELDLDCGDPWIWARSPNPGVINVVPKVVVSTTIVSGATIGSFSVAPSVSYKDYFLQVEGTNEVYRITLHTASTTAFTLDSTYNEESVTTTSCDLFKLNYEISDVLRLVSPMSVYRRQSIYSEGNGQIDGIDPTSFDRDYPKYRILSGAPDKFTVLYQNTDDGKHTIRFNRVPQETTRIEYSYIPFPDDLASSSIPLLPLEHRKLLSYACAYEILKNKNDDRKDEFRELTKASLAALIKAYRKTKSATQRDFGRLIPRRDLTNLNRRYFGQESST